MSRITIKDLARLLDVNVSTISRALANHPNVTLETRRKVQELADRLGYVPNQLAANLRRKHSGLIALILADMNMFFLPSVIQSIGKAVRESGYRLIILQSNDELLLEEQNIKTCQHLAVEGVLVTLASQTPGIEHFSGLAAQGIPVVFFDKIPPRQDVDTVAIDDEEIAYKAVRYLIDKGHTQIYALLGRQNLQMTAMRHKGYARAMQEANLPIGEDWVLYAGTSATGGEQTTLLLEKHPEPAALFVMSDELLVGAVQAAEQMGRHIPQDLSIIAISDGFAPEFYNPKITHLHHSGSEVGLTAWRLLEKRIQNPENTEKEQIQIECSIVELKSVTAYK